MSAKGDLAATTESAERAIDLLFAPAARRLGELVRRQRPAGGPLDDAARRAILRELDDAVLDALYGPVRGGRSALGTTIARHAELAFSAPVAREARRVAGLVDDDALLAAMREG